MGSLSSVLACIYLEILEFVPIKHIIHSNNSYFTYINDILLIYHRYNNFNRITERLNNVEASIKFTRELESNNTLHFLGAYL